MQTGKIEILVFSWRDPKHPLAGGAEQVMHEHMKGWINAGHSVTLFSSHFSGALRNEILDGVKIIRYGYQILGVHLAAFFWYFFAKHPKFDLVVDEFHGIPFFTPVYVSKPKLAVLQEVAKEVWLLNPIPFPIGMVVGLIGYIFEPFIFLFYRNTQFMVGSNSAMRDLMNFGIDNKRISVVAHGVNIVKRKHISKEKIPTITFLGALTKDKGIEDALITFSILEKLGKFKYWVIGKGDFSYLVKLKEKARKLGITKNIKFWGYVDEIKKFELLARSHLLINPSAREGWGLVNIEANRMETPVISYNSPGLVDSVKDGVSGVICQANTPKLMADNVDRTVRDSKKYRELQIGALNWSKQFSWEKSSVQSNKLVEKLVNN